MNFSIKEMWRVSQKNSTAWGIEGYDVPRKYHDPNEIRQKREFALVRPGKISKGPAQYVTKKGHYLDRLYKSQKIGTMKGGKPQFYPGPGTYSKTKTYKEVQAKQSKAK